MTDIDQASAIEQLMAENAVLRKALHESPARELQIANALNTLVDELTRMGPRATVRVLTWVLDRYARTGLHFDESQFRDRRPSVVAPPEPEETTPEETSA